MTKLKILTYNVCWECLAGVNKGSAKIQGRKCGKTKKVNNKNLCFRNISKISSYSKFDIIGLQEGNIYLARDIIQRLGKNYKMIYKKSCNEYSIIIYNSSKLKKIGKCMFGKIEECGRPFLFQQFIDLKSKKKIIVGNFHGPHIIQDWVGKYISLISKLKINENTRIIIFGDFNRKLKRKYSFNFINKKKTKKKKTLKPINLNINTGTDKNKLKNIIEKNYNEAIDNILLSRNIELISKPETLSNINNILLPKDTKYKLSNYSSDHRPIAAEIKL